jgi:hypothetical protein
MCETCQRLSEALCEAASRLTVASIQMHDASGKGKPDLFNAARLEAQSLRKECEALRSELHHHRAEDHPPTQAGAAFGRFRKLKLSK